MINILHIIVLILCLFINLNAGKMINNNDFYKDMKIKNIPIGKDFFFKLNDKKNIETQYKNIEFQYKHCKIKLSAESYLTYDKFSHIQLTINSAVCEYKDKYMEYIYDLIGSVYTKKDGELSYVLAKRTKDNLFKISKNTIINININNINSRKSTIFGNYLFSAHIKNNTTKKTIISYSLKHKNPIYYQNEEKENIYYPECKSKKGIIIQTYKTDELKCDYNNNFSNSIRCKFTEKSLSPIGKCGNKIPNERKREKNFIIKLSNNKEIKSVDIYNYTMEYTYKFIPSKR